MASLLQCTYKGSHENVKLSTAHIFMNIIPEVKYTSISIMIIILSRNGTIFLFKLINQN